MNDAELTKLEDLVTKLEKTVIKLGKCLEDPALPSSTVCDFSDYGNVINTMRHIVWECFEGGGA